MNEISRLEFACLCAIKAFAACYQEHIQVEGTQPAKKHNNAPTSDSNGIPVCEVHGKAMRPSKYGEGQYYCGAKLENGGWCKEKAWAE